MAIATDCHRTAGKRLINNNLIPLTTSATATTCLVSMGLISYQLCSRVFAGTSLMYICQQNWVCLSQKPKNNWLSLTICLTDLPDLRCFRYFKSNRHLRSIAYLRSQMPSCQNSQILKVKPWTFLKVKLVGLKIIISYRRAQWKLLQV